MIRCSRRDVIDTDARKVEAVLCGSPSDAGCFQTVCADDFQTTVCEENYDENVTFRIVRMLRGGQRLLPIQAIRRRVYRDIVNDWKLLWKIAAILASHRL